MTAENLRTSFLVYCHESSRNHLPHCQQMEARQDVVQKLSMLQLQFTRCHSAYECAKTYSDAGPLLSTMARSRLVAYDSQLCQAVVSAAMEYSKVLYLGVYSSQKASLWFSHLVKSLLAIAKRDAAAWSDCTDVLQKHQLSVSEVDGGRFVLQKVLRLFAKQDQQASSEKNQLVWQQAFSLCSNSSHPDMLLGELLDGMDDCGWRVLEKHELVEQHSIRLLTGLPLSRALVLWKRVEQVRAVLVLHLLSKGMDGARLTRQVVRAVLSTKEMARQMATDFAWLVTNTRDRRVIGLWRQICSDNMDAVAHMDGQVVFGCTSGDVVELFSRASTNGAAAVPKELLFEQWRVALEARNHRRSGDVQIWLGAAAAAGDELAFDILDVHFGGSTVPLAPAGKSGAGLTLQQVVWREMALDVAAFLWAPLVGAGARAVAAAKDSVLSEWRQRRRQAGSKEHHRK